MKALIRNKQKIVSILAVMIMIVGLFSAFPVKAAESVNTGLKASKNEVMSGEVFDINVYVDQNIPLIGLLYEIHYDSSKVEIVSIEKYKSDDYSIMTNDDKAKSAVRVAVDAERAFKFKDGNIIDIKVKALDNIKGNADFVLNVTNLTKEDYSNYTPEITNAAVKIKLPPTDISALTSKLTEARGYLEAEHTATSFAALKAAITEAEKITTENTKEEVQAQVDALQKAIDGLKKAVDKAVLKTALEAVPKDLDVYTPETADAVRSAQVEAQALLDNADLEDSEENQVAVKAAADKLNEAVKALQALPQKDVLANKIKEAEAKLADGNTYMTADREAVEVALKAAQTINEDENATEAEVSKAIADLDKAVSALRIKADRAAFDEALAQVKNNFIEENYTTGSWKVYQPALAKAEELSQKMTSEEIAQSEADSILEALQTASKGLVPVATAEEKATMEKAIADAEALKAENYTKASYEKVTEAIKAAQALDLKDSSSETVKAATEAIHTAVKGLVTVVEDQDSGIVIEGLEAGTGFEVTDQSKDKDVLTGIEESVKKDPTFADAEKTEVVFAGSIKPEVAPDGSAVVKIPVAKAQQGYQAYFYGLRNADGSYTWKKAELKDGMIVFSADSFGEFAVIGANFPAPQEPAVPGTGTTVNGQGTSAKGNAATGLQNESAGLMIAGLLIVAAAGFAGYRKKMTR